MPHEPDEILLGFARALRAAGLLITADRARTLVEAIAAVGLEDVRRVYWAGRASTCSCPEDLADYDKVFVAWFHGMTVSNRPSNDGSAVDATELGSADGDDDSESSTSRQWLASSEELLRNRDIAELSDEESKQLLRMFGSLRPELPTRRTYRREPWPRGVVDRARTLRQVRRSGGGSWRLAYSHASRRPRRVVMLIDVSGSMSVYADALLRLAHTMRAKEVEAFTLGTRLTRVTGSLRIRDTERAVALAGSAVPDWSGGTRLGETLKVFLDRWGQRGMARGAVVVIFSDGWEVGDPNQLEDQMRRLARLAHRVIWVNPHKGAKGYEPVQKGMAAALPHCDGFVAGHSLAAFEELLSAIARA